MATRQLHMAEPMFIDDGITDGFNYPASSNAVYDALAGGGGGGGGVLVVTPEIENGDIVLDKTWKEIHDAMANGQIVVIYSLYEQDGEEYTNFDYVYQTERTAGTFMVRFLAVEDGSLASHNFSTDSENGYPTTTLGE